MRFKRDDIITCQDTLVEYECLYLLLHWVYWRWERDRKREKERQRGRGTTSPESASMSRWVGGSIPLLENGSSFLLHPMMKPGMLCGEPLWGPSTAEEVRNPRNHSSYGVNMRAMDIMDVTMINYRGKMCFILLFPPYFRGGRQTHWGLSSLFGSIPNSGPIANFVC